jgi:hypothetical protein
VIRGLLDVSNESLSGKYLGMPMDMDNSMSYTFKYTKRDNLE